MQRLGFEDLKARFTEQHIIIAANGPSLQGLEAFQVGDAPIFTVNAGLQLLENINLRAQLLWIQDTRMMVEKAAMVLPYLDDNLALCVPHGVQLPAIRNQPTIVRYNALGNNGFSHDPRIGAFSGYTAVFGLLQFVKWIAPSKVTIFGLDMGYGSQDVRAYQKKRGLDVDLHINDRQVAATQSALSLLGKTGIEIDHRSPASILHSAM